MADQGKDRELQDEVLTIRVHTKVTKGGRNLSFGALVAVGDGNGRVGLGYGKAPGVPMAIEKANKKARQEMIDVPLIGDTVIHEQVGEYKSSRILIKPAAPGTGVKAGGTVRPLMMVLGVNNVLTKSIGRNNPINLAKAAMKALEQMRAVSEVERLRGMKLSLRHPQFKAMKQAAAAEQAKAAPSAQPPQSEQS